MKPYEQTKLLFTNKQGNLTLHDYYNDPTEWLELSLSQVITDLLNIKGYSKFAEILDVFKLKDELGVEFYSPILTRLQTHKRVFFAYAIFP